MSGAYVKLSYSKWTFRPPELPLANQFYTYKKHIEQSNKNTIRPKTIIPFAIEVGIYAAVILAVVLIIWVLWLFNTSLPDVLNFLFAVITIGCIYSMLRTTFSYLSFVSELNDYYNGLENDIEHANNYMEFISLRVKRNKPVENKS